MLSKLFLNTHIDGFVFQGSLSFLQNLSNGVECDRKVTLDAVHSFRAGVGGVDGTCATVWPTRNGKGHMDAWWMGSGMSHDTVRGWQEAWLPAPNTDQFTA